MKTDSGVLTEKDRYGESQTSTERNPYDHTKQIRTQ